jgi:hypothetical protein
VLLQFYIKKTVLLFPEADSNDHFPPEADSTYLAVFLSSSFSKLPIPFSSRFQLFIPSNSFASPSCPFPPAVYIPPLYSFKQLLQAAGSLQIPSLLKLLQAVNFPPEQRDLDQSWYRAILLLASPRQAQDKLAVP